MPTRILTQVRSGSRLLLALAVFLLVNILANQHLKSARLDLTAQQLYTLSEGTRRILANLQEPIHLWFYVSRSLTSHIPGMGPHVTRIQDLLDEYVRMAGSDKLRLTVVNPEPFSVEEDMAMDAGLRGIAIPNATGKVYLGLVAQNSQERMEMIPFLLPAWGEQLEYDLTALIYRLTHAKRPVLGLLTTLPMAGIPSSTVPGAPLEKPSWAIHKELAKFFTIKSILPGDDKIDPDVDLLMVVHPRDLPNPILYAADQFVLSGKPTVMFADPFCQAQENATPWLASSLPNPLLSGWGIKTEKDQVAADLYAARKIRFNSVETGSTLVNYPVWIDIGPRNMHREDPITTNLDHLTLATAGIIAAQPGQTTKIGPLFTTGNQGGRFDLSMLGPASSPQRLIQEYKPEGPATLAARLHGPLPSAFPDGRPAKTTDDATTDRKIGHLNTSREPVRLVLVADCDLLQDQFWVRRMDFQDMPVDVPYTANGRLVMNILDDLLVRPDLISARNQSRSQAARPFVRLLAIRQQAELQAQEIQKVLNQRLQETQIHFLELQQKGNNSALNASQQAEIEKFSQELLTIRKEQREARRRLNLEVEHLQTWIKFLNIGLIPLLVGIGGILVGMRRIRRAHRAAQTTQLHF
ncbi:MAG: Gldg family protein [Magnetococcales bacterium]|nr:Gldg family protein [Magnetococcales bacterium]MBF0154888.1 Gldg family protein [Magnetococcales bacterium]